MFFSVIIPTYNRSSDLNRCLNELIFQDFKNFEIIIIDDGSTDNTRDIVFQFEDKLNINYIKIKNSGGPAKPRNIGIDNSKGKYLCFLDSDDTWFKDKLSSCYNVIQRIEPDVIFHKMAVFKNDKYLYDIGKYSPSPNNFNKLVNEGNLIVLSSLVVKKESISNNISFIEDSKFSSIEDYYFILKLAEQNKFFHLIDKTLGRYYISDDAISKNSFNTILKTKNLLKEYFFIDINCHELIFYMKAKHFMNINKLIFSNYYFFKVLKGKNLNLSFKSFYWLFKSNINELYKFFKKKSTKKALL